ncbi:PilZ domain-containing protein [Pelobacter propionicus]|uniref:Type IV pilus assembly PilZ n=1 Tax=Pelobacter propionicus (strain DSM 2379 / NBRC 103807 / OttBd1) TaxID=338966 RepID=A1AUW0_PELPD|nr:PilZ domain-containing protein [Pelobacter propionicus]ABL01131.1 type IV pilus assembly PilZ [Pelobacter propionicus DSM 2379]
MNTRKFSRVRFRVNATVRTAERQFQGSVENLSMNGMFLVTGEQIATGEAVEISIQLTGSEPEIEVNLSGRACRLTEDGIGFTFEQIELDSYTHLKNIISYNMKDSEKVMEEIYHAMDEKLAHQK